MTPEAVKVARHSLGMSVGEIADWLGLEGEGGRDLVRAWEKGKKPITGPASRAIRLGLKLVDSGQASSLWTDGGI